MNKDLNKLVEEIMKEIPDNTIPKAYVKDVVEENIDCFDTRTEVLAETKMQLTEESGMEFMLTRREAEDYLCDAIPDEKWEGISTGGKVSSRIIKAMEEDEESTLFELLKSMPLIPAAKLISSIILRNLEAHGVVLSEQETEELCVNVIDDLNTSLFELEGNYDDDDDEEDEDEDEYEDVDVLEEMGLEFDIDDSVQDETGDAVQPDMKISRGRRSRITRFPGKK